MPLPSAFIKDIYNNNISADINTDNIIQVPIPDGNYMDWNVDDVGQWLMHISSIKDINNKGKTVEDEINKIRRIYLYGNYLEQFVKHNVDGNKLSTLNKGILSEELLIRNVIDRSILMNEIDKLVGRDTIKTTHESNQDSIYVEYIDKHGNKKKRKAGPRDLGRNNNYKGSVIKDDKSSPLPSMYTMASVFEERGVKKADIKPKDKRKKIKRYQTVSEINKNHKYIMPDYADEVLEEVNREMGNGFKGLRRYGGEQDVTKEQTQLYRELKSLNVPIPKELTKPIQGYHTILKRNEELKKLLNKYKHLHSNNEDSAEMKRLKALERKRREFDNKNKSDVLKAIKSGNYDEHDKIYGKKNLKGNIARKELNKYKKQVERNQKLAKKKKDLLQKHKRNQTDILRAKKTKRKLRTSSELENINRQYRLKNRNKSSNDDGNSKKKTKNKGKNVTFGDIKSDKISKNKKLSLDVHKPEHAKSATTVVKNSNDNNNDNNDDVLAVNVSDGDDDEISGALGLLVSPNSNSNHELRNSYSNLLKLSRNASANTTSEIVTDDDFDQIVAYKTKSNATSPVSTYSNLSTPKTTRVHERFETFVERDVNNSSAIDNIMDKPVDDINDDSSDDDVNDESNDDNIPLTVKLLGGSNNIANDTILESADDDDSDEFE